MVKFSLAVAMLVLSSHLAHAQVEQNFEAGQGDWFADNGSWEVGTPTSGPGSCHQGTRCAGTILAGNYPKANSRLVSPAIRLAQGTTQNPVLMRFWHWFSWANYLTGPDQGIVQISAYDETGATWSAWTSVGSAFYNASSVWTLNVVDLTPFSGRLVRVGFYHQGTIAYGSSSGAGWYVDDIEIHGTAVPPGDFSVLQNFETTQGDWFADNGSWEVGTPTSGPGSCHQGTRCAGTILGGNYPKANSRLVSPAVRLAQGTSQNPVRLRFWHWFSWANYLTGPDQGVVQISAYDETAATWSAWTSVGSVFTLASGVWTVNVVDLTPFSGRLVRVSFYHQGTIAYGGSSGAGWYVDDIEIQGTAIPPGNFSALQNFETGQGDWFADNGVWEVGTPTFGPASCHQGTQCAGTVLGGNYPKTNSRLVSPPLRLAQGTSQNPVLLRFWHWFTWANYLTGPDQGVVQISAYDETAATWSAWTSVGSVFTLTSGVWTLNVVDLTRFSGRLVRVGFYHQGTIAYGGSSGAGWYLDDIEIGVASSLDSDNDGLPDDWETRFGLNPLSATGDDGAGGDPDADGTTNLEEYRNGTHPRGFFKRYLAEGAINAFFDTRLALLNVGTDTARVLLRFLQPGGAVLPRFESLPPSRRRTLVRADFAGLVSPDFSTVVESDQRIVVDRTMSWDATGYGSHAESSLSSPETTWYLAEGSTSGDFVLFYLLQNPNPAAITATITYLLPFGQPPIVRTYPLPASSRTTIPVDAQGPALASTDVSAVVTATQPIIAERAMYRNTPGQPFAAGHESAGVTSADTHWFLAEGATGPFFDMFLLLANPNQTAAVAQVDYLLSSGATHTKSYVVPANGRFTIWVDNEQIPAGSGLKPLTNVAVSATVTSTNGVPIIVERTMWWPGPELSPNFWTEAHNSPGATATGTRWALAEGEVGGAQATETYILIANTSPFAGQARVSLYFEDGSAAERVVMLLPSSRTNVNVSQDFPQAGGRRFGAIIDSLGSTPAQIVVERAMYTSPNGQTWAAGTNALGTRLIP